MSVSLSCSVSPGQERRKRWLFPRRILDPWASVVRSVTDTPLTRALGGGEREREDRGEKERKEEGEGGEREGEGGEREGERGEREGERREREGERRKRERERARERG